MQAFKTRWFARFAKREEISDKSLRQAIDRAERGLIDADLGGGLIKQRGARPGQGRSRGYRVIVAYRARNRAVFLYGFAKSSRANIDAKELATARNIASIWLDADEERMARGIREDEIQEVIDGEED